MLKPKYLYHVTTRENANEILKTGLIPKIGPNSELACENKPYIYLCERKDVPYWRIILNRPVVLAINTNSIDKHIIERNRHAYENYAEYHIDKHIKPEFIKKVYVSHSNDVKINNKLCLGYLMDISSICKLCAEYYTYYDNEYDENDDDCEATFRFEQLKSNLNVILLVLNSLNYKFLSSENIKAKIKDYGESGECTLCDIYNNTDKKLYQMLIEYPDDDLSKPRQTLYEYIIKNLSCCLDINTGGWGY